MANAANKWDHELVIGDTYEPASVYLTDGAGAALDLTDVTGTVALRRELGGEVLLQAAVEVLDAAAGLITWSAPASDTEVLDQGELLYGVRLTWPTEKVQTVLEGRVTARLTAAV